MFKPWLVAVDLVDADLKICLSASSADAEIVGTDSLDVGRVLARIAGIVEADK
jgi:hypothetical protein